ncbi:ribonuclease III [Kiloniella sp. b19]|uniref:ribonuclease III n=1 Tax=Kiloniella sp. GXU_MW_B19 TaxID=3141326 RepID=UPI0031E37ED7
MSKLTLKKGTQEVAGKGQGTELSLEARLDYRFHNRDLLKQALTHPGLTANRKGENGESYERLEFLGDRVLGLVVSAMLFKVFPKENEGALAKRFTALVRMETLAMVASSLQIEKDILLSRGDEESGERANPSLHADVCEAIIAALYLDGGFEAAERFIKNNWKNLLTLDLKPPQDAKSALQEWAQARSLPLPSYREVERKGPAHAPEFVIEVSVQNHGACQAEGASKRKAEQQAATLLLETLKQNKNG